jgi:hypothetical protein
LLTASAKELAACCLLTQTTPAAADLLSGSTDTVDASRERPVAGAIKRICPDQASSGSGPLRNRRGSFGRDQGSAAVLFRPRRKRVYLIQLKTCRIELLDNDHAQGVLNTRRHSDPADLASFGNTVFRT